MSEMYKHAKSIDDTDFILKINLGELKLIQAQTGLDLKDAHSFLKLRGTIFISLVSVKLAINRQ